MLSGLSAWFDVRFDQGVLRYGMVWYGTVQYGTVWIKGGSTQDVQLLRARLSNKEIDSFNKGIRLTEKARMVFDSLAEFRCAGKYVDKDKELQQPSSG